jgi:hypothetical protein
LITPTRTYLLQTAEGTDIVMSFWSPFSGDATTFQFWTSELSKWIQFHSMSPTQILPQEVLQLIMSYLDHKTVLQLMRTCKRFYPLAKSDHVWKLLCLRNGWNLQTLLDCTVSLAMHYWW